MFYPHTLTLEPHFITPDLTLGANELQVRTTLLDSGSERISIENPNDSRFEIGSTRVKCYNFSVLRRTLYMTLADCESESERGKC